MIKQMWQYLEAKYGWNEEGATAVEYGLMVALIAVVIIVAVALLGTTLRETFFDVEASIANAGGN
jgi:pilus assembly protein Flp/PilA